MKYQIEQIQRVVDKLVEVQESIAITQLNIGKTMALLQQSHSDHVKHHEDGIDPKVNELWENRSQMKGGYIVISAICGLLVGGAAVGGFFYMILKH